MVWASRGLRSTVDRYELERLELGGRVGFVDSSSAETDLLEGVV